MSGTYNMNKFLEGELTRDYYESSPLDFVPDLDGEHLAQLRERFILLAHGAVIGQLTALRKTALHLALEAQRDGNVRQLLASAGGPDLVMVQGRP